MLRKHYRPSREDSSAVCLWRLSTRKPASKTPMITIRHTATLSGPRSCSGEKLHAKKVHLFRPPPHGWKSQAGKSGRKKPLPAGKGLATACAANGAGAVARLDGHRCEATPLCDCLRILQGLRLARQPFSRQMRMTSGTRRRLRMTRARCWRSCTCNVKWMMV
jgi:hypothetical protein